MSDKSNKKIILIVVASVFGMLVLLGTTIAGTIYFVSMSNKQNVADNSSSALNEVKTEELLAEKKSNKSISKYEDNGAVNFDNITFEDNFGMLKMIGEVTSQRQSEVSFMFTVSLYDSSGTLLDTFPGVVNNLQAGQTKTFTTMSTFGGDFDTYKIQIDNAY